MIVELLSDIAYGLFYLSTLAMNIPDMPEGVREYMNQALDYIGVGLGILANFTDLGYLLTLFSVIVAVDVGLFVYKIVLWILKKIPAVGVE